MSLYEQYYSDINKNYMFEMVQKVMSSEDNIDISDDEGAEAFFLEQHNQVFKENNIDELPEINKVLLDKQLNYYRRKYSMNNETIDDNQKEKSLQELINERKNTIPMQDNNNNVFVEESNNGLEMQGTPIETILSKDQPIIPIKNDNILVENISINSCKRSSLNSSRYNYKIDLSKERIKSEEIRKISKLMIPIEENYLFSIPMLRVKIPELECDIYMQQKEIINNSKNRNGLGIYEPVNEVLFDRKNINRLTIDIRDITNTKYSFNDILNVNILEILDNVIIFTCSNINTNNFKVNDSIKIINNYSPDLLYTFKSPFTIKKIINNQIFCRLSESIENNTYNNIDMKLLNMSNQNVLFFN
tara:strand:- start:5109 stop:6188 length:1080 start_codon:yes stop_codon:yes gene_type:complete